MLLRARSDSDNDRALAASEADLGVPARSQPPPLIAHVIHRLGVGGLENGLVNLINHMPAERYRHAVICLTDYTDFRRQIQRPDVPVIALNKREGNDLRLYGRLWLALRRLKPDIVHTRNLSGLECQIPALVARVTRRVHGEHGRDVFDLHGSNPTYNRLRRLIRPLVHRYISVSADLARWLVEEVGVKEVRVKQICNGVDSMRFRPRNGARPNILRAVGPAGFMSDRSMVIGTVGRMAVVKDQLTLARAFTRLLDVSPKRRKTLRLVMVGDGPLRERALKLLRDAGCADLAWLPGERSDIPEILHALDVFVLPSLGEGLSNTVLEAMSTGLPVVATRVGGNPELVIEGQTGLLVTAGDPLAMAAAIEHYLREPGLMQQHGRAGRRKIEQDLSLEKMVEGYLAVYDAVMAESHWI